MSASEVAPGVLGRLVCDPGPEQEHVEVLVLDGRLEPIERSTLGRLEVDVPAGAYKVEFRAGSDMYSELVVVTQPGEYYVSLPRPLQVSTAAPVPDSSTSHEWQSYPAEQMSHSLPLVLPGQQAGSSHLFLFVREHDREYGDPAERFNPGRGLSLHSLNGQRLLDLGQASAQPRGDPVAPPARHGVYDRDGRWTAHHVALDPGPYLLRLDTGSGWIQNQVVHAAEGWQTQVFLISRSYGRGRARRRRADLARMSLLMSRPGTGFQPYDRSAYLTEVALQALATGRAEPGAERTEMLWAKYGNPMLGLFGAFLQLRRPRFDPYFMQAVFDNLLGLLGPHPDVLALGWAIARRGETDDHPEIAWAPILERVQAAGPIATPPMLSAAWDCLIEASFTYPTLIPSGSLVEEVSTRARLSGAWLVWTTEGEPPRQAARATGRPVRRQAPSSRGGATSAASARMPGDELGDSVLADGAVGDGVEGEPHPPKQRASGGGRKGRGTGDDTPSQAPPRPGAAAPGPPGRVERAGGDGMQRLQATLDELNALVAGNPPLAARVAELELDDAMRRLLQAAVPQADPLLSRISRRSSVVSDRLYEQQVPVAALIRALRLPAATLMTTAQGLLEVVRGEAAR